MSGPRAGHTATLLGNGEVLVAGGDPNDPSAGDLSGVPVDAPATDGAERYSPATGQWTQTGSLVAARMYHTATLLPSGKVLVAGGLDAEPQSASGSHPLASAELYDPATGRWSATGSMISARAYQTATLLPNGKVLVAGGDSSGKTAELYDPSTGRWSPTGSMINARTATNSVADQTATPLPDGKVLVTGSDSSGKTAELYNPSTGAWSPTGSMISGLANQTATLLANGNVLVTGAGTGGTDPVELYNPATGSWRPAGSIPELVLAAVRLSTGEVLAVGFGVGGFDSKLYEPSSGRWLAAGNLHLQRIDATATLLPSGKVLVAGGEHDQTYGPIGVGHPATDTAELWSASSANRLGLISTRLKVVRGRVRVSFGCQSRQPCQGKFSIVLRSGQRIGCTKPSNASFSIPAETAKTVRVRLGKICLARLRAAPGHHIGAKLSARLRSSQRGLAKTVRLVLR
jgi:hypothetical protein